MAIDEPHERRVERDLQRGAQFAADARRDAARGDRDPARPRLDRRLHRDEAVFRLIDRAQQELVPVGERAHADRRRLFLRGENYEERVGHVFIAHVVVIANPRDVGSDLAQRLDLLRGLTIVFGADDDALAIAQVQPDRIEDERILRDVERGRFGHQKSTGRR